MGKELTAEERRAKAKKSKTVWRMICIVICVAFGLVALWGIIGSAYAYYSCTHHKTPRDKQAKYIQRLLDETPSEFSGYALRNADDEISDDASATFYGDNFTSTTYIKDGEELTINGIFIFKTGYYGYKVIYKDTEITIDKQWMMDQSKIYFALENAENTYENKEATSVPHSELHMYEVGFFDNEVFIILTSSASFRSKYPALLFHLDLPEQTASYVGYTSEWKGPFKIVKIKEEDVNEKGL